MAKKLLLAVLLVAVVAMPAFASVQNLKISGSLNSTFVNRENFDLGYSSVGEEKQNVFLTQTNLRVDADLTDNVSATVALINERPWTVVASSDDKTNININLAYVTLREMLYSPLTVVVGRQSIKYGNNLIVGGGAKPGNSGLASVARDIRSGAAFDAVRAILDYNPLNIEVFAAKIDADDVTLMANGKDDIDFFGIDAKYELGDELDTMIEGYFFAKYNKQTEGGEAGETLVVGKADTIYTPGLRVSTNPLKGLNLQAEYAHQAGTKADASVATNQQKRSADIVQLLATYALPVFEKYAPVFQYSFTYASGDKNTSDKTYKNWDSLYESQSGGKIYNTLFNLTNCQVYEASLKANPIEDVTAKVGLSMLWLDKPVRSSAGTFGIYQPDSTAAVVSNTRAEARQLGTELDFEAKYAYTEDVQFGANLGWFFPGDVFAKTDRVAASQALLNVNVNF